jgi:hypothetical protein
MIFVKGKDMSSYKLFTISFLAGMAMSYFILEARITVGLLLVAGWLIHIYLEKRNAENVATRWQAVAILIVALLCILTAVLFITSITRRF